MVKENFPEPFNTLSRGLKYAVPKNPSSPAPGLRPGAARLRPAHGRRALHFHLPIPGTAPKPALDPPVTSVAAACIMERPFRPSYPDFSSRRLPAAVKPAYS